MAIYCWKCENSTDLTKVILNPDVQLLPSTCELTAELNGTWQLNLTHIVSNDRRFELIEPGGLLQVPSFNGNQYFRITQTEITESEISAVAYPIFYDAMNWVFIPHLELTDVSGQDAVNQLNAFVTTDMPFPFQIFSDITEKKSFTINNCNLITALNADSEDGASFVSIYGAQLIFDNFKCYANKSAGVSSGIVFQKGKNIKSFKKTLSIENVVNRIFPVSGDGYAMSKAPYYADLGNQNNLPIYAKIIKFEDYNLGNATPQGRDLGLAALVAAYGIQEALSGNDLDEIHEEIDIEVQMLSGTEEYSRLNYKEKVSLGDTAIYIDPMTGEQKTAQITSINWDCLKETATSIKLGSLPQNYFDKNSMRTVGKEIYGYTVQEKNNTAFKLLWEDSTEKERMGDGSRINLNEKVSDQEHGIKLKFGIAQNDTDAAYGLYSYQDVLKDDIEEKNSYSFTIKPASGNFVCSKQLQVYDEFITGASYNTQSGSGYQNGRMVLVAVFGW